MRVLYLCHRIPYPPDKGDKIRAFHQLRGIAERHEVDVFLLADFALDLVHESALAWRLAREICPGRRIHVIPNGADSAFCGRAPVSTNPDAKTLVGPAVTFVGDISYFLYGEAAGFFAKRLFPLIRDEMNDARFLIVGIDRSRRPRGLRKIGGVEATGRVRDVRPRSAPSLLSVGHSRSLLNFRIRFWNRKYRALTRSKGPQHRKRAFAGHNSDRSSELFLQLFENPRRLSSSFMFFHHDLAN